MHHFHNGSYNDIPSGHLLINQDIVNWGRQCGFRYEHNHYFSCALYVNTDNSRVEKWYNILVKVAKNAAMVHFAMWRIEFCCYSNKHMCQITRFCGILSMQL